MARIARVVVPGLPHPVTQRGNRREPVVFEADDYRLYRRLGATAARRAGTAVWAYCLMPNHVHLIVTPADEMGCVRPLPKRTGVTPGRSTLGFAGPAICSRVALARW
jgi:putative transposase